MMESSFDFPVEKENTIEFYSEDTAFEIQNSKAVSVWIGEVIAAEKKELKLLSYILCSDDYLHKINVEYLNHDTLTDVITFPYGDSDTSIEGDIFISVDRIRENAEIFKTSFENELHRVIIHGALHLCGYGDKTEKDAKEMRQKENQSLKMRKF